MTMRDGTSVALALIHENPARPQKFSTRVHLVAQCMRRWPRRHRRRRRAAVAVTVDITVAISVTVAVAADGEVRRVDEVHDV